MSNTISSGSLRRWRDPRRSRVPRSGSPSV